MMLRTDVDHLPWQIQQELRRVTAILFEAFADMTKGRCSEHYRAGRIVTLILHGPHVKEDWELIAPGVAFHLTVIVNHPRLARREREWRIVRDRLRRAWEYGEITRPARLTIESMDRVNRALIEGIPHLVAIAEQGIALYQMEGLRLQAPRRLPARERAVRSAAEFMRWHRRGRDFLSGATFYLNEGNAPMAALLLHQACEHLYLCVLWSINLHGPRIHALDELREAAEALDSRLCVAWPRHTPFERRAFGCIRRAYVEARYGQSYRISPQELAWAFGRAEALQDGVVIACADHYASLIAGPVVPMLPSPTEQAAAIMLPQLHNRANTLRGAWRISHRATPSQISWRRLLPFRGFWRSSRSIIWGGGMSLAIIGLCLFLAGADAALWRTRSPYSAQAVRSEPADPSAVLDFNVQADTVLGAVGDIADRAGYRVKTNEDIWAVRWTGSYRAKATTFDALADVLYGSGLCPSILSDTITVRYCNKTRPPTDGIVQHQARADGGVVLQFLH